jgi:4-amino-4-deoxy-L-arabinose transferase-like glycosyltransferase
MRFFTNTRDLYRLSALFLICIGVARIVSTYYEFNQTVDEPSNIACGMQLLQYRLYMMDVKHPPLSRISVSLGAYLEGARLPGPESKDTMFDVGNTILNRNNSYWHNLTLARLGTLPFFILACIVVWRWADHLFGPWPALFSLLFVSLLPPMLAHGSLATNDMAGTATLCLALYCFTLWIENPTGWAAARLGIATGLAVVSKFSALLFLPGCAAALLLLCLALGTESLRKRSPWRIGRDLLVSLLLAYLVLWTGYLFTLAPIQATQPHTAVDRLFGSHPAVHNVLCALLETPFPAGKAAGGIAALSGQNKAGQVSFFLGEWRRHGWWYFFPIIFLVKTPVAFLLLSCIGSVFLIRSFQRGRDWRRIAPLLFAGVILALSTTSRINIGVRHILAIYPLLSIVSGYSIRELWGVIRWPMISRLVAATAVVWLAASSVLAHPDYLAYFNLFASDQPERIEVDSDLDWGQDLARLSKWLRAQGVQEIALSYFGTVDLTRAGLPDYHELQPYQKVSGWVAISARYRVIPAPFVATPSGAGQATYYSIPGNFDRIKPGKGAFAWLMAYKPVARIGRSIFVYYIPPQ